MFETPFQRIVVGLAPGGRGLAALRLSLRLVGATGTVEIVVVNDSVDVEALAYSSADVTSALVERAREAWSDTAERIEAEARRAAGPLADRLVFSHEEGRPIDALLERGRGAQLVAVGRRAPPLGKTSELLVRRHAGRALLVPEGAPPPERVIAAYAGKALGVRALRAAAEFARELALPLRVLTVEDDPERREAIQAAARAELSEAGVALECVGAVGDPAAGLLNSVSPSHLLVLAPHGRTRLGRLFLGSVAEEVAWSATFPLVLTSKRAISNPVS